MTAAGKAAASAASGDLNQAQQLTPVVWARLRTSHHSLVLTSQGCHSSSAADTCCRPRLTTPMAGTGQHIFITIKAHGRVAPEPERQLKSYTNRIPVCALTNTTATSEPIATKKTQSTSSTQDPCATQCSRKCLWNSSHGKYPHYVWTYSYKTRTTHREPGCCTSIRIHVGLPQLHSSMPCHLSSPTRTTSLCPNGHADSQLWTLRDPRDTSLNQQ